MTRLRRLVGGSLLAVILTDVAAVAVVAVAGAFVGYQDAAAAIWAWRRDHLIESLAISVLLIVLLRRARSRFTREADA